VQKSCVSIFLKRSKLTSVANCHTFTYKSFAPSDNPAHLESDYLVHSDNFVDLHSVRLLLFLKFLRTDRPYLSSAEANTIGCVNNLLHSMFRSLIVSLNG
jgi:hypothetical protein